MFEVTWIEHQEDQYYQCLKMFANYADALEFALALDFMSEIKFV